MGLGERASLRHLFSAGHLQDSIGLGNEGAENQRTSRLVYLN